MNVQPNIQTQNFHKVFYRPWELIIDTFELIMTTTTTTVHWAEISAKFLPNLAEFWPKLAIMWAIIGEFDNFSQNLSF